MKLNLGCGFRHPNGFVNVDSSEECKPDRVVDLETLPWPFEDDGAEEVLMSHVLEHLGQDPKVFGGIIKELYRVCEDGALVTIIVPFPRHDLFLIDPTHVRALLPETFQLLSKKMNLEWRDRGVSNTPLALYLDVDFEIESVSLDLDQLWKNKLAQGKATPDDVADALISQNNVVEQFQVALRVRKPAK